MEASLKRAKFLNLLFQYCKFYISSDGILVYYREEYINTIEELINLFGTPNRICCHIETKSYFRIFNKLNPDSPIFIKLCKDSHIKDLLDFSVKEFAKIPNFKIEMLENIKLIPNEGINYHKFIRHIEKNLRIFFIEDLQDIIIDYIGSPQINIFDFTRI